VTVCCPDGSTSESSWSLVGPQSLTFEWLRDLGDRRQRSILLRKVGGGGGRQRAPLWRLGVESDSRVPRSACSVRHLGPKRPQSLTFERFRDRGERRERSLVRPWCLESPDRPGVRGSPVLRITGSRDLYASHARECSLLYVLFPIGKDSSTKYKYSPRSRGREEGGEAQLCDQSVTRRLFPAGYGTEKIASDAFGVQRVPQQQIPSSPWASHFLRWT
jgi:hypothetical protein